MQQARVSFNTLAVVTALTQAGRITPEVLQELDGLDLSDWPAADPIIDAIQSLETRELELKAQALPHANAAAPLIAKAKVAANAVEALKDYLKGRMQKLEVKRLEGPTHVCRLQPNSAPTFAVADPNAIPAELAETITKLDLAKAKVAYKENRLPAGVTATVGEQLRIDR